MCCSTGNTSARHQPPPASREDGSVLGLLAAAVAGALLVMLLGTGPGSPLRPVADGVSRTWNGITNLVPPGPGGPGPR